ncbi:Phospholipid phosphatase-related protein type 5 [Galemys pyrenaicus]|uniref:Phospholipid phosphatase-related protein type 5 n=1 Tax=Galemys pyrenaicus TaxID=202257 RepID=A0A8J6A3S9_GALPY|nr:Phospholipid phosphatase-related protein type 5 [Galemys pyrenaicus]
MPPLPAALTSSMLYFQMVIMAGTVMLAYYFEYTDTFTVNVQGFFCHDSAYRKPYPGPEDSSAVPPVLLYSLAAGVPVLVVSRRVLALSSNSLFQASPSRLMPRGGSGRGSLSLLSSCNLWEAPSPEDRHPGHACQGWVLREPPALPTGHPRTLCGGCGVGDPEGDGREVGGSRREKVSRGDES